MPRKVTFQEFIAKAENVHAGWYSYPVQKYTNLRGEIKITCPLHGEFTQLAGHHANGSGCRQCANKKIADSKKKGLRAFLDKANLVHGSKYLYPEQVYAGCEHDIRVICPTHGEFKQLASSHLRGHGCPKCGVDKNAERLRGTFIQFVTKARETHGERYGYPEQAYLGVDYKAEIICDAHGSFLQSAYDHIRGSGCPRCKGVKSANEKRSTLEGFIAKAKAVHGDRYEYPQQKYVNSKAKIQIICPVHGEFYQKIDVHLSGCGCQKCGYLLNGDRAKPFSDFVEKAKVVHGTKYQYLDQQYGGSLSKVGIFCDKHGVFKQAASNHLQGSGCPKCVNSGTSKGETALSNWFSANGVVNKYRVAIDHLATNLTRKNGNVLASMELDMYFKEYAVAVEYNGLYWHEENRVGKHYHKGKTEACKELGIDLIQIFEDEWLFKPEIVKSIINTRLGVYENRYYARKTKLIKVDAATAGAFYEANHIQGKTPCKVHYGLTLNGDILAMASFGNRSHLFKNSEGIELIRFCTKLNTQVVGGLSKLLSVYRDVPIKTFCDLRLFNGNGYKAVGFEEMHVSPPSYFYFKNLTRLSRFNFQKHKLEKVLDSFDNSLTEVENMENNGYSRVFDCGTLVMSLPPRKTT